MRMLGAVAITTVLASIASANVFVTAYRCDGTTPLALKDPNTPLVYQDIMVGTRSVLIVSNDRPWTRNEWWWGSLLCTADDWERGKLAGRGYVSNGVTSTYRGSYLPAAGGPIPSEQYEPWVTFVVYNEMIGFDLQTLRGASVGDWFVLDYVAEKVGPCKVSLFDFSVSFDAPTKTLTFNHVPSRDFNGDRIVNFADLASLACAWRQPVDPNAQPPCLHDLDGDLLIGPSDVAMFADYWLEQTDCAAATEPNAPAAGL